MFLCALVPLWQNRKTAELSFCKTAKLQNSITTFPYREKEIVSSKTKAKCTPTKEFSLRYCFY
jgi:hypothetical protein